MMGWLNATHPTLWTSIHPPNLRTQHSTVAPSPMAAYSLSHIRTEGWLCGLSARDPRLHTRGSDMKDKRKEPEDELRPEYSFDYSNVVRGKYYS